MSPLGLLAGMSAADAAVQKKIYGSGYPSNLTLYTTTLLLSIKEMEDIMKMVKSLEESVLLIKGISETIKNETKEQKGGFLPILLATLAASILGNALTRKGVITVGEGRTII